MTINIIEYITSNTKHSQADIAKKLGVSRSQVTKWKAGDRITESRRAELNELAGLFGDDTEWALITKTKANARAWAAYLVEMNRTSGAQTTYLTDDPELHAPSFLCSMSAGGIPLPDSPPPKKSILDEKHGLHAFNNVVSQYIEMYGCMQDWWTNSLANPTATRGFTNALDLAYEIEGAAIPFALTYVEEDALKKAGTDMSKLSAHLTEVKKKLTDSIGSLCQTLITEKASFSIDPFDLLTMHPDEMRDEAWVSDADSPSIMDYLPYGERKILEEIRELSWVMSELDAKVNKLLPKEA